VVRDRAVGTHDEAVHALALARRRLDAAARGEERAATRVAELEQRLVEARRHRDDSGLKLEQARTAIQRAEARVEDASTGLERAEADLARIPPDGPERSSG
jgi:chromosome segregation ATPase